MQNKSISLFNQDLINKYINKKDIATSEVRSEATNVRSCSCQSNKNLLPLSLKPKKYSKFGITNEMLKITNLKLKHQKEFLLNNYISNSETGQIRSLFDVSLSANFSSRYYAEVANRVNVIQSFQIIKQLKPVFLTITLNGCFRDALKADFTRFKAKDRKSLPADLKYKMEQNQPFTIKDLSQILNHNWHLFVMRLHRKYKNLDKSYIRSFEPHKKDGVPHIHCLLNIPPYAFEYALKTYKDIFYAPQNLKSNMLSPEQKENGEINGFQWTLNNPTGYVMKYIQKTFINHKVTDKLDRLSAWYVIHKIRRFITSKNQVPLWIYRKINFFKKDYYHVCEMAKDVNCICEWDFKEQYFRLENTKTNEIILYENGKLEYKHCGYIIKSYQKDMQISENLKSYKVREKLQAKSKKSLKYVKVIDENNKTIGFINQSQNFIDVNDIPPAKMKDYQLYNYYTNLDLENCNLHHFGLVKNELIARGLIDGDLVSLNEYNTEFKDF